MNKGTSQKYNQLRFKYTIRNHADIRMYIIVEDDKRRNKKCMQEAKLFIHFFKYIKINSWSVPCRKKQRLLSSISKSIEV
jgi:hypothetical protein